MVSVSERTKTAAGVALVLGLSVGLFSIHLQHATEPGEGRRSLVLGTFFPLVQAGIGILGASWLWSNDLEGAEVARVGAWCATGATILAIAGVLTVLYQQAEGVLMSDRLYIVANGATSGLLGGFVVGVYDSRQRVARRRAAAAGERAERLSDQLTVLNRVLRHDLRNGVNIIQGYANLISADRSTVVDHADRIDAEAQRLVDLGDQAREIEAVLRSEETDRETVEIPPIVETAVEHARNEDSAAEVSVSIPDQLRVRAHPLTSSAIQNVVENAVEHNDESTPRVTIEAALVERDGAQFVELRIADNGPGIPDDQVSVLERGFETSLEHGSGLGLWLVNWVVGASGGRVRFNDNDPKGSVVSLQFEAASNEAGPLEPTITASRTAESTAEETSNGARSAGAKSSEPADSPVDSVEAGTVQEPGP